MFCWECWNKTRTGELCTQPLPAPKGCAMVKPGKIGFWHLKPLLLWKFNCADALLCLNGFTPPVTCPPPDISHCPAHPKEPLVRGGGRKAHSKSTTSSQHETNYLAELHPMPGDPNPTCPPLPPACPCCLRGEGSKRPTLSDSARFAPK